MEYQSILTAADRIESYIRSTRSTKAPLIIAIDGRCGSGKSTLANHINAKTESTTLSVFEWM